MPAAKKRELVKLLARHDVALVEDDVYAELHGGEPSIPAKAFDDAGRVMHCGSFSKCLAPGYRLGWCVPGRALERVARLELTTSISTSAPVQEGVADYLQHGGYDHHLRALRARLTSQRARMLQAIAADFPSGTRVTRPDGGYFLWVQLPAGADAMAIFRAARVPRLPAHQLRAPVERRGGEGGGAAREARRGLGCTSAFSIQLPLENRAAGPYLQCMKIIVMLLLLAIVASLFSGLYFVGKDKGGSDRAVKALTVRIVLSIGVFSLLMASQYFGLLGATGRL